MDLYKIVSQLTHKEFDEVYSTFTANNADKSAAFLKIIRENPESPDKDFLAEFDIAPSAFYVLKSRLNQKIEAFLLNRVGDSNLHVVRRVLSVNDLVFNNPREITVAALRKLEKELLKFDFPYGLMIVYKELQNQYAFDEDNYTFYKSRYNRQVAYALAMDEAVDHVVQFFYAFDNWYLSRKDRDLAEMVRAMEKIDNKNNLYDSHRLFIFKAIIHIFARLFIEIPDDIRCEVEELEAMFDKSFEILEKYKDDAFYKNINILFNFLRFVHYDDLQVRDKANMYYEILDYKIEELLQRYHYNAPTSLFLARKLQFHKRTNTLPALLNDVDKYITKIELEPYRIARYVNFHFFIAQAYFVNSDYKRCSRILYTLRNEVNLRKYIHVNLEVKFFQALSYVMMEDFDLANQLILSLQRQLRKPTMSKYAHGKILLKILNLALAGRPRTRSKNLTTQLERWKDGNVGRYALLEDIDLEKLFQYEEGEGA